MAQYCNAFVMETDEDLFRGPAQNPDSFASWQGRRGPYYTPVLAADGTLSWVNNGGLPNPQPVNIAGPPGQGLEIQGVVETVQQLPTGAAQGDVWLVGTASPYEAFIWVSGGWLDLGQVAVGPAGPQGEPGPDGVSPEIAVTEISGGHRVTITDAGGTEAFDVLDGEDGAQGSPGAPGAPGAAGSDGTTFTPAVSAAGVISWTNDGGKANPDPVNIKGPQGAPGSAGAPGAAATISVGTVSGLPAGSTPTVTNSGSSSQAVFDFGIPAGADGATGPTGPAGPGVASGGSAGQILAKVDGSDYNTNWINPPDPSGFVSYAQAQTLTTAQQTQARSNIGANWTLLWQNASPTSAFAAQTIPFSYTDYDFLAIVIRNHKDDAVQQTIFFQAVNGGGVASSKSTLISNGMFFQYREGYLNSTGLAMSNALEGSIERRGTTYPTTANYVLVPVAIYGLKNL